MKTRQRSRLRLSNNFLALLLMFLGSLHSSPAQVIWESLGALPEPIGGGACAVVGDRIIMAGGTNWPGGQKIWVRKVRVFDVATSTWSDVGDMPLPRAYGVHGVWNGALVVAGGSDGTQTHRDLWRFPNAADGDPPKSGVPQVYAGGGILGVELILAGGGPDANDLGGLESTVTALNLETGLARQLPPMPGAASGILGSAVCGGRLCLFGGARWDAETKAVVNLALTRVFSGQTGGWKLGAAFPHEARGLNAVALDDRHVYVGGGFRTSPEGFSDEAFVYDVERDHFAPAARLPLAGMTSLVIHGDSVYCLGGEDRKQHRSDGFWRAARRDILRSATSR
jgi:hypothetical protein